MNKKLILIGFVNCLILAAVALFFIKKGNPESYCPIAVQPAQPQPGEAWKLVKSLPSSSEASLLEMGVVIANQHGKLRIITAESTIADTESWGDKLVYADSSQAKVSVYAPSGELVQEISGYEGQNFKVPSPYFSLSVSEDGELWVTDPGRKCLVQFDAEGKYRATWQPQDEQAFLGCCNPARMRCLAGGRFATLEKGHVRVRIFSPSGAVESTVADFGMQQNFNYDMVVKDEHKIIILDGNKQIIYFYQKD